MRKDASVCLPVSTAVCSAAQLALCLSFPTVTAWKPFNVHMFPSLELIIHVSNNVQIRWMAPSVRLYVEPPSNCFQKHDSQGRRTDVWRSTIPTIQLLTQHVFFFLFSLFAIRRLYFGEVRWMDLTKKPHGKYTTFIYYALSSKGLMES